MFRKERFQKLIKKKEIEKGKEIDLEKGDLLALLLAAFSVFVPVILLFCGAIALFIFLFFTFFH